MRRSGIQKGLSSSVKHVSLNFPLQFWTRPVSGGPPPCRQCCRIPGIFGTRCFCNMIWSLASKDTHTGHTWVLLQHSFNASADAFIACLQPLEYKLHDNTYLSSFLHSYNLNTINIPSFGSATDHQCSFPLQDHQLLLSRQHRRQEGGRILTPTL